MNRIHYSSIRILVLRVVRKCAGLDEQLATARRHQTTESEPRIHTVYTAVLDYLKVRLSLYE
jgi:hypothetical protein